MQKINSVSRVTILVLAGLLGGCVTPYVGVMHSSSVMDGSTSVIPWSSGDPETEVNAAILGVRYERDRLRIEGELMKQYTNHGLKGDDPHFQGRITYDLMRAKK